MHRDGSDSGQMVATWLVQCLNVLAFIERSVVEDVLFPVAGAEASEQSTLLVNDGARKLERID